MQFVVSAELPWGCLERFKRTDSVRAGTVQERQCKQTVPDCGPELRRIHSNAAGM